MSGNILFLGNKIFEIPPFFQTRPGDLGQKVHACSLRFSALNSHTFYFETRPSPLLRIRENAFGAHFLQLYRKKEYGDPHFLFHDFNKDSASFR